MVVVMTTSVGWVRAVALDQQQQQLAVVRMKMVHKVKVATRV